MSGDMDASDERERFRDVEYFLSRRGGFTGPHFDPTINDDGSLSQFIAECPVLCVGAGGLGCEILKDLALSGFKNIHVIDLDTIDVTNLNRQFLFRMEDVGKPKADTAAKRIMSRVRGVHVTPHHCRIEDKPDAFYGDFTIIVLGLDSLEARRYMNAVTCSFLEFDADGNPRPETIKPMIDGGTEGFKGHARVIYPGVTPCFECTLWLFPPQVKFPLCTLAETPRSPAHCIEYAHLILWGHEHSVEFDSDNEAHMQWVFEEAAKRAAEYDIPGVTLQLTQGVVKNIIPAIPSTNAIIAAACVLEALKIASQGCLPSMDNYMMYMGNDGVYTHTVQYARDPDCPVCGPGLPLEVTPAMTLQEVLDAMKADAAIGKRVEAPSVAYRERTLYMRGPLEPSYHGNLSRPIGELLAGDLGTEASCTLMVTDRKLQGPMKVRLTGGAGMQVDS